MSWFTDIFNEPSFIQTVIIISIICAVGIPLGQVKIKGLGLGATCVFFAGIIAGHLTESLGLRVDMHMMDLARNFGLVIFVYALGVQVGPGFFTSLKKGGMKLNLLAISVIVVGTGFAFLLAWAFGINAADMMGLLSGAVTNTPMLGAAQQTLLDTVPSATGMANNMASACAVGYPFGVIGVILAILVLKLIFFREDGRSKQKRISDNTYLTEHHVTNPAVFGKSIKELMGLTDKHFVISRLWRNSKVIIPCSATILEKGDYVLVVSQKKDVTPIFALFGEIENKDWNDSSIDWNVIDSNLVSKPILVTRPELNGVKLGSLKIRNHYGVNITRVNRAGIDLLPSPDIRLQVGDTLTVVGEDASLKNVSEVLGNELKDLRNPNLLSLFIGIALGLILGMIPFRFPGISLPVKLGIAGGPIIAGILMGAFGPRLHLVTYTTRSANLMLRQLGITVYLACLGFGAGGDFFETVLCAEGLLWICLGTLIAALPAIVVGFAAAKFFHTDFAENVGMICGSMANPMALAYSGSIIDEEAPNEAYATVYPVSMFLRVISAQIIIILAFS
ncbi:MAG: putative transporter [Bacteroidales bacterium]|nr:putative transporter [Bacteroidales bacterium]